VEETTQIYLDNNATTQPLPEVRDAMLDVLGANFGNPSSAHTTGDRARDYICQAREAVADLLGADPEQVIFTSGGTEANNTVLTSFLSQQKKRKPRFVTSQVEHSSVLKMAEHLEGLGVEVVYLPVSRDGRIAVEDLQATVTPDTSLVSIQWVNNETGVIQPIERVVQKCREHGVPFHTDAAQAVGRLKFSISDMEVDFLSFTGHKLHGPQGVGVLYARNRRALRPVLFGGPQEDGLRAGTENVPGIVGLGKAAAIRRKRLAMYQQKTSELRDRLERRLREVVPGVAVNGDTVNRVCNTTNVLFRDVDGQALVAQLDLIGIRCSQSSACTNQRPEPSYVLRAMGLSEEEAYSSIRFSFCEQNTAEEADYVADKIAEICQRLRRFCGMKSASG
jgi:cysteine desulfurase